MKNITKDEFGRNVKEISSWVDQNNSRNIGIWPLFWNTCINFGSLIKKPRIIINKLRTFLAIIKDKKSLSKTQRETKLHD